MRRRTDVGDVLQHIRISRDANQELELAVRGATPQEDNQAR
jgi:hypothetical protein